MAKFVVLKKGGGGRVAINPEQVTYIRSATGAFTDVFVNGQQVAVEGTFEEVVRRLATPERRAAESCAAGRQPESDVHAAELLTSPLNRRNRAAAGLFRLRPHSSGRIQMRIGISLGGLLLVLLIVWLLFYR